MGENRIHTLHAFSGWYVDGRFVKNPFATRRNADGSAIVTAEVPPARVITIEVSDDKNIGEEGSASDSDNSQAGNVGMIQSSDGDMSHSLLQSDNSSDVGKSVAVVQSSVSSHSDNSAHSDGIPSSYAEADGSQNGGKRKDEPPAQQGGLPLQPDGIPSNGNGGYSLKSNGYNHSNGSHSDK